MRQNLRTATTDLAVVDLPDLQIDTTYALSGKLTFSFEIKIQMTYTKSANGMTQQITLDCYNEPPPTLDLGYGEAWFTYEAKQDFMDIDATQFFVFTPTYDTCKGGEVFTLSSSGASEVKLNDTNKANL